MNDNARDLRTVTLHNDVSMPTLAFGTAFGDGVGATDFQGFLPDQHTGAIPQSVRSQ